MILPNGTLVAVLDGATMRLFLNKGHDPHVELVALDTPKLEHESAGSGGRHRSSTANPDGSRQDEDDFVAAAVAHLNREALAGRLTHVAIIADPRTLGEMRRHYGEALSTRLLVEIGKDLAHRPPAEIEAALRAA